MFKVELGSNSATDSTQMVKIQQQRWFADWGAGTWLSRCYYLQISIQCAVLPIYATVAAKTKAAWEIISLKSSSKLHPVCPMPAGPGDCAGVLIHLKAEDLCCCFQGAWPTMHARSHSYTCTYTHTHTYTCTKTISSTRMQHKFSHSSSTHKMFFFTHKCTNGRVH